MLYSIKNRDHLEKLNNLVSSQNRVRELRLQDHLGKQNFHENIKKVFEPVTVTTESTSEDLTKTMMLTSEENNKVLENLNDKRLEIMMDRGILASNLMSPSSKITNPEHTSQYK